MSKKVKKTRLSLTLTPPYMDRLNILIKKGLFMEKQDAIREFIRDGFKKYGLDPF
ncbi:hypothetical protein ES703_78452 [subsurface metagenome]